MKQISVVRVSHSKSDLTTVANKFALSPASNGSSNLFVTNLVRSISNFQLSPRQLELCGGGSKIVQRTILARTYCLEVRGTLFKYFGVLSHSLIIPLFFLLCYQAMLEGIDNCLCSVANSEFRENIGNVGFDCF